MCLSDAYLYRKATDRMIFDCIERDEHTGREDEACASCNVDDVANYYAEERQGRAEYLEGLRNDD